EIFIALEFAGRGSLQDLLRDKDIVVTLEGVLLRIALEVAGGMHYLHTRPKPVIHRDLKSENVLITTTFVAKLVRFFCGANLLPTP
ncbi:MAG: protein kinase, partial [Gemmataceae bacterium]